MRDKLFSVLSLIFCLGWGGLVRSSACGYHDPAMIRVGALNWHYPDSLHVTGAIWEAQQAGSLPMPDKERIVARGKQVEVLNAVAYQKTSRAIRALNAGIQKRISDEQPMPFSLVLVETALWSQFSVDGERVSVAVDTNGPQVGDLVVASGELVVQTIEGGDLTLAAAVHAGLVKLYGEPEQISGFLKRYGTLGSEPLPTVSPVRFQRSGKLTQAAQ